VEFNESKKDWIYAWWRGHLDLDEYPCMAAAACDYIAIPGAEIDFERLFNKGQDLLGL
jgi:hypothetical protein